VPKTVLTAVDLPFCWSTHPTRSRLAQHRVVLHHGGLGQRGRGRTGPDGRLPRGTSSKRLWPRHRRQLLDRNLMINQRQATTVLCAYQHRWPSTGRTGHSAGHSPTVTRRMTSEPNKVSGRVQCLRHPQGLVPVSASTDSPTRRSRRRYAPRIEGSPDSCRALPSRGTRAVVRRWRGRFVTGACFVEVSPGVEPGYPSHDVCE
jgi:hypothetical protein